MSHPLLERVRAVGRSGRRLLFLYAVSCGIAIVLAASLGLGLVDYLVRFSDAGVRWLCFASIVAVFVLAARFFVLPAIRFRRSEVQIARHIERRFPALGDQLSSTIAFLAQSEADVTAGSATLRRLVIADTTAEVEQLNLSEAISRRVPLRAFALAFVACAVTAGVFVLDPVSSSLAARRLLAPWNDEAWPRRNELRFVDPPAKLALGHDFSAELIDEKQRLTGEVIFEYRYMAEEKIHAKPMKLNRSTLRYAYQLTNVDRSLEYRASGGDDVTAWQPLLVVAPVRITKLQVSIHPPEYTGWKVEESDGHIRALVGSRIELRAEVDKPLSRAVIKFEDDSEEIEIPAQLSEDGLSLTVSEGKMPWLVNKSGRYRFEMTEREDPVDATPPEFEIQAVSDNAPKVILEQPGKHTYVTRNAVVPLRGMVEDDLAVASVDLRYGDDVEKTGPDETHTIELYRPSIDDEASSPEPDSLKTTNGVLIDYQWDLSEVPWLRPEMTVAFRIAASDFRPQEGQFLPRQLSIITVEQLLDRVGHKQSAVLEQLAEALRVQREVKTDVEATLLQLSSDSPADASLMDQMQGAELRQRRVQRILVDGQDGVTFELETLIQELDINRVDDPGLRQSLLEMLAEVRRIDREHLTLAQRDFVQSIEQTRRILLPEPVGEGLAEDVRSSLKRVGEQQEFVIASLERMIGQLSQWDSFQRVARDLRYLRQQQEALSSATEQYRLETIGMDYRSLDTEQRTELGKLGLRQSVLARQFEKLVAGMARMRDDTRETEPLVSQAIDDAIETAARLGISTQLRESASAVKDNRIATAVRTQRQTVEQLREMLDVLSNRRENELGRRLEQLEEAADELAGLREEVESLDQQTRAAKKLADSPQRKRELERLNKQRAEKADQLERLARRLQRLQAQRSADATSQAGAAMGKSGDSDSTNAQQDEHTQKAKELLDEAQKELDQELGRVRQELAREQMVKLEQQIAGLAARQTTLVERTIELHQAQTSAGSLTRAQKHTVLDMSREERTLALEVSSLATKLAQSEAFRLGLSGASREMLRAAGRLGRGDIGSETQESEQVALRRLQQLIEALKQETPKPNGNEPPSPGELGDLAPEAAVRLLAELKLLKLMQSEIRRRTIELEEQRLSTGAPWTEQQLRELMELASEQGRLSDLMLNLSKPLNAKPEDDPASLPKPSDSDNRIREEKTVGGEGDSALKN